MKRFVFNLIVLVAVLGCRSVTSPKVYKPETPAVLTDEYSVDEYHNDKVAYEAAIKTKDLDTAKTIRNKIAWNMTFVIDNNFEDYSGGIAAARAGGGLTSDMVQSGIAGAASIVKKQQLQQLLSVILLGSQNLDKSVKNHFFSNVSPETFIGAMKQARLPFGESIKKGLSMSVIDYPLEQARSDLGKYFWAGTLYNAQLFLANAAQK